MRNFLSRKVAIIAVSAAVILILVLMLVPGLAADEPPNYVGIINFGAEADGICHFFNGQGGPESIEGDLAKIVATPSQNNNILLQCEAEVTPSDDGMAKEWDAFDNPITNDPDGPGLPLECKVNGYDEKLEPPKFFGNTLDWRINISASGNAVLTCQFKQ